MTAIKRIFAFLFLFAAASCIDPYTPNIKGYKSLLVVEGFISNESSSYRVKLQRTTNEENSARVKVNDASVYITDGDGLETYLQNCGDGNYKTDSTSFTGVIGQRYILHILTSDGKEYKSEACTMLPVADIDSIYFEKGEEITGIQGEMLPGIKIFLNSADATGKNQYFRWTFEETWKFHLPYPQRYNCLIISIDPSVYLFEEIPVVKEICWKKSQSEEILINSVLNGETNYINRQLIKFIAPSKSDRLTHQFSILVKQYSISEKEYNFWNNLKKVSEAGGDIFDSQPYQVFSNVQNVNDAGEMVLGYFEVSAVSRKRIFISAHQLDTLYLPQYQTDCAEIIKSPSDWPSREPITFWDLYHMFMDTGDFTFVRYVLNTDLSLQKLVFAPNACAQCKYAGFSEKPDFWIESE